MQLRLRTQKENAQRGGDETSAEIRSKNGFLAGTTILF